MKLIHGYGEIEIQHKNTFSGREFFSLRFYFSCFEISLSFYLFFSHAFHCHLKITQHVTPLPPPLHISPLHAPCASSTYLQRRRLVLSPRRRSSRIHLQKHRRDRSAPRDNTESQRCEYRSATIMGEPIEWKL